MVEEKYPARLHVLIARNCDQAIVIRRGPSKSTCIISWNRNENAFEVCQWLRGRIYERRSDISPSGKHWIYFAMNGKWDSEAKGAWTAIARTPWLKAISLYAKGDCWNGGGLFLDDKTIWLNDGCGHEQILASSEITRNEAYTPQYDFGGECLHVYYNRLQRDGWVFTKREVKGKWNSKSIFEKALPDGWFLRKISHEQVDSPKGKGCYWDEHEIQNGNSEKIVQPDWEWADWVDNSIVYAQNGRLHKVAVKNGRELYRSDLLHDFNGYTFENLQAPY